VRARQARRYEVDHGVRVSRRVRHGDVLDARTKRPALAPGDAVANPDVRLARPATDLRRTARNADGSWREGGAEVKASCATRGDPIAPACALSC
jgi:hypothetical protein